MNVVSVSQLNRYIKALADENKVLNSLYVRGEVSNFVNHYRSGHFYFTLKDENSQIKAVMFKGFSQRLKFSLENGMKIICRARLSVYEKDGTCQLYVEDIQPEGVGALSIAFEQLKAKLSEEGLFDESTKRKLPKCPSKIGVATSDTGAAVEDIKNILKRRWPLCEVIICPTTVQGENASKDIVDSIDYLNQIDDIDLIIVGRGGGSAEDLQPFNTEEVARAVYNSAKPVISAVGHETDFTICDFVCDLRAPTPSAAAEIAVPDCIEEKNKISNLERRLLEIVTGRLETEALRLDRITEKYIISEENIISSRKEELSILEKCVSSLFENYVNSQRNHLKLLASGLDALSPLKVISRGYCAVQRKNDWINSVNELKKDDIINLKMNNGSAVCTVNEVNINE